jgi:hypothetical protein
MNTFFTTLISGLLGIALAVLFVGYPLFSQTPGTITTTAQVVATAGDVTCTGKPGSAADSVDVTCSVGGEVVFSTAVSPKVGSTSGIVLGLTHGQNSITMLLRKISATALTQWEVSANGVVKSGTL